MHIMNSLIYYESSLTANMTNIFRRNIFRPLVNARTKFVLLGFIARTVQGSSPGISGNNSILFAI